MTFFGGAGGEVEQSAEAVAAGRGGSPEELAGYCWLLSTPAFCKSPGKVLFVLPQHLPGDGLL